MASCHSFSPLCQFSIKQPRLEPFSFLPCTNVVCTRNHNFSQKLERSNLTRRVSKTTVQRVKASSNDVYGLLERLSKAMNVIVNGKLEVKEQVQDEIVVGGSYAGDPNIRVLAHQTSEYNDIVVVEVARTADHPLAGCRALLLDKPGNIHSIYSPFKVWSDSYYDVCATLIPIVPQGPIALLGLAGGTAARNGVIVPLLQEEQTWTRLKARLRPGGRIMVNCAGACVESPDKNGKDGETLMCETVTALSSVFPNEVFCQRVDGEYGNVIALTGSPPNPKAWARELPEAIEMYAEEWILSDRFLALPYYSES